MKIELDYYELQIITSIMQIQRVMLSPVPSNDTQREVMGMVESKLKKYLAKMEKQQWNQ